MRLPFRKPIHRGSSWKDPIRYVEDDPARLAQWKAYVPTAQPWLEQRFKLTLDNTPDSLIPLWKKAYPQIRRPKTQEIERDRLPEWARWRGRGVSMLNFEPDTVQMLGAILAYAGTLLINAKPPSKPPLDWIIFHHPIVNTAEEGELCLARPHRNRKGVPTFWIDLTTNIEVLAARQVRRPAYKGELVRWKNNPTALRYIFDLRLAELDQ